jgi:hypothetical protein
MAGIIQKDQYKFPIIHEKTPGNGGKAKKQIKNSKKKINKSTVYLQV